MKMYDVWFDWADYMYEHTTVHCDNKRQIKKILTNHFGDGVVIRNVEEKTSNDWRFF